MILKPQCSRYLLSHNIKLSLNYYEVFRCTEIPKIFYRKILDMQRM